MAPLPRRDKKDELEGIPIRSRRGRALQGLFCLEYGVQGGPTSRESP